MTCFGITTACHSGSYATVDDCLLWVQGGCCEHRWRAAVHEGRHVDDHRGLRGETDVLDATDNMSLPSAFQ